MQTSGQRDISAKEAASALKDFHHKYISLPTTTLLPKLSRELIKIEGSVPHSHDDGKVHTHDGIANLTWLDMNQASIQAATVRDALVKLVPSSGEVLRRNAVSCWLMLNH